MHGACAGTSAALARHDTVLIHADVYAFPQVHFVTPPGRGPRISDPIVSDMADIVNHVVDEIKYVL